MLGTGAATSSYADIEVARSILVCGSNPTENHPVVGARIKQAVLHGAHLIVIDPRRIELAGYVEVHLRPRPGTGVALLNAMAAAVIEEGLIDEANDRDAERVPRSARPKRHRGCASVTRKGAPVRLAGDWPPVGTPPTGARL